MYLNNIQLDVWYYRLVLYTFELQAVMEESNSSSLGSEKAAKVKPRRTKSSRPSYASKSREVLVPVVCVNFFFLIFVNDAEKWMVVDVSVFLKKL